MIGSAQLRRRSAVLQHGSILLDQPQDLMRKLLRSPAETAVGDERSHFDKNADAGGSAGAEGAEQRHANLYDVLNERVSIDRLQEAMKVGFEKAFQRVLVPSALNEQECRLAAEHRIKYQAAVSSSR